MISFFILFLKVNLLRKKIIIKIYYGKRKVYPNKDITQMLDKI